MRTRKTRMCAQLDWRHMSHKAFATIKNKYFVLTNERVIHCEKETYKNQSTQMSEASPHTLL